MKTKTVLMLGMAAILIAVACKKNKTTSPGSKKVSSSNLVSDKKGMKQIKQKMYDVDESVSTRLIKQFKHEGNQYQARLIDSEVAIDSAIWVLEAALNYDYDSQHAYDENYENFEVTYEVSMPINQDLTVLADNLEDVYEGFQEHLNDLVSETIKIKIIDVEAYTYDPETGVVVITAKVAYYSINIATNCFFLAPAYPVDSIYQALGWGGGYAIFCTSPPTNVYATKYFESVLNCETPIIPCDVDQRSYWTNIGIHHYTAEDFGAGNPYPTALYESPLTLESNICSIPLLTTNQLGAFKSNALPLAQSNITWNISISYIKVKSVYGGVYDGVNQEWSFKFWWELYVNYGKWNCKTIID